MSDLAALKQIRSFQHGYDVSFTGLRIGVGLAWESVWSGPGVAYPWATAPREFSVVSTAVENTSGGTGAQSVEMTLTDPNLGLRRVEVATDGQTPVTVPGGPYLDVLSFNVLHAGSFESVQAGEVNLTAGGVEVASIEAGSNKAFNSQVVVPAGWTLQPIAWKATVRLNTGNALAQFRFVRRFPGEVWIEQELAETNVVGGGTGALASSPVSRPGTQFELQARADSGTIDALASLVFRTSPGKLAGEITL